MTETLSPYAVDDVILTIRGHKVILDADLAHIYGVETKNLNKACRRNMLRFPEDFVFRLTADEVERLRFQNGTSNPGRGGRRYLPFAFTEHGAIMAATVLNSSKAVEMSVFGNRGRNRGRCHLCHLTGELRDPPAAVAQQGLIVLAFSLPCRVDHAWMRPAPCTMSWCGASSGLSSSGMTPIAPAFSPGSPPWRRAGP